ncbi:hypothetical protein ACFV2U_52160 [Streptomyces sp. NPDC059697]|uniref:hypothetical protein n=1 Tax=Streptomyces sp. NPDC059697 TaxID=3346912 RepID=UPI003699DD1F
MHDAWWEAVRQAHRDTEGTRTLIEVLHRHMAHERVVAGIATALGAGALTADAVAPGARRAAQADRPPAAEQWPNDPEPPPVTSLTARPPAGLPGRRHPAAAVAGRYDALLRHRPVTARPEGEPP